MRCVACGAEFSQTGPTVSCPVCHTVQLVKGDRAMSMNSAESKPATGMDRAELLEKLNRLTVDMNAVTEEKKAAAERYNEQLKDLKAEIDDILTLLNQ